MIELWCGFFHFPCSSWLKIWYANHLVFHKGRQHPLNLKKTEEETLDFPLNLMRQNETI